MDVKIGRMNTIIGYNGFLAPYRPFYSSDYQFFYSQDGAFTGFLTNLHVNERLEIWNGMTLGANTFFTTRSDDSICYIGQVNYWLTDEKRTRLTASVYAGPNAIFAAPGLAGTSSRWWSCGSSRTGASASPRSSSPTWAGTPTRPVGTGSWYGLYTDRHLPPDREVRRPSSAQSGSTTSRARGPASTPTIAEVTLGVNWHPIKFLDIRPEIRGDFAGPAGVREHKPASAKPTTAS